MSGNKRPAIGRRELQALGGYRDAFLLDGSPVKANFVSAADLTPLSPQDLQRPTFTNLPPTEGQLSLPTAGHEKNIGKELFGDHRRQTRAALRRRRAHYLRVDFNIRFRSLPAEVKDMIFRFVIDWDCNETPALVIGLRTRWIDQDVELYKAAWRAFCFKNTFVLTRQNSYVIDQNLKGSMPPEVWQTIRSLKIKHEYMGHDYLGYYRPFFHNASTSLYCKYSPCTMCDHSTILLATNVRDLHLDFGDSYHCIIPAIERTCKVAIEEMQLERLVLTMSNIWSWRSAGFLMELIWRINNATEETGRLLSVGTKAFSAGPYTADFASESWFWNSTRARKRLTWVDDWEKKRADDEAEMERLYGPHARAINAVVAAPAAEDDDGVDYDCFEDNSLDDDGVDEDDVDSEGVAADDDADGDDIDDVIEDDEDEGVEDEGFDEVFDEGADDDGAHDDGGDDEGSDGGAADIENGAANTEDAEHDNSPFEDDADNLSDPDESQFADWISSPR